MQKTRDGLRLSRAVTRLRAVPCATDDAHPEPGRSSVHQRAKSDVLWMNAFSFEMFTLPKPVVASQPAFAL